MIMSTTANADADTNDPVEPLLESAREHQPFGEPDSFGFETRLRAALGEMPPSLSEYLARFSWGVSAVSLPLLVLAAVFLAWQQSFLLPDGFGGVVDQWSSWLPLPW